MTVKTICADSTALVTTLPSNQFDLTILDPDYQDWDSLIKQGFIEEAIRVTKPTGNLICFTKQPFDHQLRNHIDPWFRREIVWLQNPKSKPSFNHSLIFINLPSQG